MDDGVAVALKVAQLVGFGVVAAVGCGDAVVGVAGEAFEGEGAVGFRDVGDDGVGGLIFNFYDGTFEGFFAAIGDGAGEGSGWVFLGAGERGCDEKGCGEEKKTCRAVKR